MTQDEPFPMNSPILNRDFQHPSDGWYHIEPAGEHLNAAAGLVQVLDAEACETIANRFNAAADAAPDFPGMLVDHEHFRHDAEKETRAYGWLMRLQNRADGLYGQIRWTDTGKKAVDGGDYRFFSTEYLPAEAVVLNASGPRRIRPTRLHGLTLTNEPNNKGGKPITNRVAETTPVPQPMNKIAQALGLPETASEADILAAITSLQEAQAAMKSEKELLENRLQLVNEELLKNREAQADADLAPLKDKLPEADRAAIRAQLIANRDSTLPLLKLAINATTVTATTPQPKAGPVLNRETAKTPAPAEDFQAIVNRHVKGGVKRAAAVRAAIAENPAAYAEWRKSGGTI